MFPVGIRKYICTAPFLDAKNCILEALGNKCLYIPVYLRKKIFVSET